MSIKQLTKRGLDRFILMTVATIQWKRLVTKWDMSSVVSPCYYMNNVWTMFGESFNKKQFGLCCIVEWSRYVIKILYTLLNHFVTNITRNKCFVIPRWTNLSTWITNHPFQIVITGQHLIKNIRADLQLFKILHVYF